MLTFIFLLCILATVHSSPILTGSSIGPSRLLAGRVWRAKHTCYVAQKKCEVDSQCPSRYELNGNECHDKCVFGFWDCFQPSLRQFCDCSTINEKPTSENPNDCHCFCNSGACENKSEWFGLGQPYL